MFFPVSVAKACCLPLVESCRYLLGAVNCIEIRNERHHDPVVSVDLVIAADDGTKLALMAKP
jgi:hypothetical protein